LSTARNEITGSLIQTKPATDAYRNNYDKIFGKIKHETEQLVYNEKHQPEESQMDQEITLEDRYIGAMVGLAVGDAIGTSVEFLARGKFAPLTDMIGGGVFHLRAGQWTDDTSMALCLAMSLIENGKHNPEDQMSRYLRWWKEGYLSSTGRCFDIGTTTSAALHRYASTGEPYSGSQNERASGNGSLMRLAPAVLFAYPDIDEVLNLAMDTSRTTHASLKCIESCQLMADIMVSILDGLPKTEILPSLEFQPENLDIIGIAAGEFLQKTRDEIRGSGYCVESLEAALWCFFKANSFDEAVLMAANLGDDADTTAAITGQLAGAYYGIQGIRKEWVDKLYMSDFIQHTGELLCANK